MTDAPKRIDFGKPAAVPNAAVVPPVQLVETPTNVPAVSVGTAIQPHATPVQPANRLTLEKINAYGVSTMSKVGNVNNDVLKFAKGSMLDEAGAGLGQLLVASEQFDPKNLGKTKGLFFKAKLTFAQLRTNFDSVHTQVEQLSRKVDGQVSMLHKQIKDLENLYNGAKVAYRELEVEIAKLEQDIANEVAYPPTFDPNDPFSATEEQKWQTTVSTARNKLEDLKRMKTVFAQNGVIISMMASNTTALIQKFNGVTSFTIPQLKTTFVMMVEQMKQKQALELQKKIDETNSKATRANAKLLGDNTKAIQEQLAKSIVAIEDLQFTNDAIIQAVQDTKAIQEQMKQRIEQERPQLEAMEQQLRQIQVAR